jgi:hypothetical protein
MENVRTNKKDNSRCQFGGHGPRQDNNQHKRSEAKERQEAWAKLGLKGQLSALDARLGKGLGATKQRARIQRLIDNPPRPTKKTKEEETGLKAGEPVTVGVEAGERLKAKDRKAAERAKRPAR